MRHRVTRAAALIVALAAVLSLGSSSAAGGLQAPGECAGPLAARAAAAPPGFAHRSALIDGVRMHYVIGGHGERVVVLLHGWPESWYEWVETMPALAVDHTVLAVDLPGLGDSRGPVPSFDKRTLARFVHRLVADTLGYQHVHLVGHDFGAGVAFAYAAFHRESVASLTLMDFPLAGPAVDERQLRAQLWWFGFHDVPQLPEQMVAMRQRTYLSWFYEHVVAPPNRIEPRAVNEYVRTYCSAGVLHAGFELYRTVATDTADNTALTSDRLTLPILSMGAARSNDPDADRAQLRQVVQPMAEGPISAELVPGAGHFLPEENPEFVVAALRAFIDG